MIPIALKEKNNISNQT